jgi:hypothetical protein
MQFGGPVFVFGAGSSAAAGAPVTETFRRAAGQHMAAVTTRTAKPSDQGKLFSEAMRTWGESAPDSNIEEFYILTEMMARLDPIEWVYRREAVKCMIAKTLELSIPGGPNLDGHQMLVRKLLESHYGLSRNGKPVPTCPPILVSLNWDVLLDAAITRRGLHTRVDYRLRDLRTKDAQPNVMPLLKLHGSLNWWFCSGCNTTTVDPPVHSAASFWNREPRSCQECGDDLDPFFVPPTSQKLYTHQENHRYPFPLDQLWNEARHAMATCQELFFVGYSFPPTDIQFRMLVVEALRNNQHLRRIVVITKPKHGMARPNFEESYLKALKGSGKEGLLEFDYKPFEAWIQEETRINPPGSNFGTRVEIEAVARPSAVKVS